MLSIHKIYTNTINYTIQSAKEIAPVCKLFVPYVIGATLCAGLKEKAEKASLETLVYVTSNGLHGAQWLLTAAAAASVFLYYKPKKESIQQSQSVESRKVAQHIMPKKEFEAMKAEIFCLKQELEEIKKKFNQDYVSPKNL